MGRILAQVILHLEINVPAKPRVLPHDEDTDGMVLIRYRRAS